jgi:hypothetical protein
VTLPSGEKTRRFLSRADRRSWWCEGPARSLAATGPLLASLLATPCATRSQRRQVPPPHDRRSYNCVPETQHSAILEPPWPSLPLPRLCRRALGAQSRSAATARTGSQELLQRMRETFGGTADHLSVRCCSARPASLDRSLARLAWPPPMDQFNQQF